MNGAEIKKLVKSCQIKQKDLARHIGVTEQALTSYFRTTDLRQETIDKIEAGIQEMSNGKYSIYFIPKKEPEFAPAKSAEPTQQKNIIDTLSGVVKDVERELADIRIIRAELYQQHEQIKQREKEREKIFAERMKQISDLADRLNLFGGVGNISFASIEAADENPRPK